MSQKSHKTVPQESCKQGAKSTDGDGGRGTELTATIPSPSPGGQTTPPPTDDK